MTSRIEYLIVLAFIVYFCPGLHCYDYCNMGDGCNHIACDSEEKSSKLQDGETNFNKNFTRVVMSRKMRKAIVDAHNEKRNEIACGRIKDRSGQPYPRASRMREVIWDNELEYIAGKHAEKCVFAHDVCRMSTVFKHAGQNLAMKTSTGSLPSPLKDAVYFTNAWYNEFKDASVSEVDSVGSTQTKAKIGHFTVMVNERVTKIGCALTRCFLDPSKTMHLFTCDYSYTNMRKVRMYKKSKRAASSCIEVDSIRSPQYNCLCEYSDFEIEN